MENEKEINQAYFDLAAAAIQHFAPSHEMPKNNDQRRRIERKARENLTLIKNNKLIHLFCDCSHNFQPQKLEKKLIEKNREVIKKYEIPNKSNFNF